jgi:hypothetical protein
MKALRRNTLPVLIDIRYQNHMNHFEETYGEHVRYSELEQKSYIELKEMIFEMISEEIKFRKFCRDNGALTVKADMLKSEYNKLLETVENTKNFKPGKKVDIFNFLYKFEISNIKIMSTFDLERNKKAKFSKEEVKYIENLESDFESDEKVTKDDDDDDF